MVINLDKKVKQLKILVVFTIVISLPLLYNYYRLFKIFRELNVNIVRKTITNDEEYLRQVSKEVSFSNDDYKKDISLLEKFCLENECFALAAVQIGIPKRIVYLKNTTLDISIENMNYNESKILINPTILSYS